MPVLPPYLMREPSMADSSYVDHVHAGTRRAHEGLRAHDRRVSTAVQENAALAASSGNCILESKALLARLNRADGAMISSPPGYER